MKSLIRALEYAKTYYIDWIAEFYVNLKKSIGNRMSSNFRKVRFRNNIIVITPELINKFLRTKHMIEENVEDINDVVVVLTGGRHGVWTLQFPAVYLTSLHSVMHKLLVSNWLSSKNSTVLTKEQTFLLYKIIHLKKFNFGQTIFDNIMMYVGKHTQKCSSPYPSLISHFLEKMEFPRYRGEKVGGFVASFGISSALKEGDRIVDLPMTSLARQNLNVA